jgi:hypothetical protein
LVAETTSKRPAVLHFQYPKPIGVTVWAFPDVWPYLPGQSAYVLAFLVGVFKTRGKNDQVVQ